MSNLQNDIYNEQQRELKEETRPCLDCGKQTTGSIGRNGIKWTVLCQTCKDIADSDLERRVKLINEVMKGVE